MRKKKEIGECLCWHAYHRDQLLQWEHYEKRQQEIQRKKPPKEVPVRLALHKPVKGKLPKAVSQAARKFYTSNRTNISYWVMTYLLETYKYQIELLHAKECPNCVWNPKTKELEFKRHPLYGKGTE